MDAKISFAEWVGERESAGLTKSEVATEIGTTVQSLYRYLSNDRVPDREIMRRILELSGHRVDVACFYVDKDAAARAAIEGEEAAA